MLTGSEETGLLLGSEEAGSLLGSEETGSLLGSEDAGSLLCAEETYSALLLAAELTSPLLSSGELDGSGAGPSAQAVKSKGRSRNNLFLRIVCPPIGFREYAFAAHTLYYPILRPHMSRECHKSLEAPQGNPRARRKTKRRRS